MNYFLKARRKLLSYILRFPLPVYLIERVGFRIFKGYQDNRFPEDQYQLIKNTSEYQRAKNSLEIGCSQGKLVNYFSSDGLFAVGIELKDSWKFSNNGKAVLGVFPMTFDEIDKLPEFDIICLLSVHHQWVFKYGDVHVKKMITKIFSKAKFSLFIEFAALSEKYGYGKNIKFIDNDESSVRAYAENWLNEFEISFNVKFMGKTRELEDKEPYRYLYKLSE